MAVGSIPSFVVALEVSLDFAVVALEVLVLRRVRSRGAAVGPAPH